MKTLNSIFSHISFVPSRNKTTFYKGLKFDDWVFCLDELKVEAWQINSPTMDEDELEDFMDTFNDVLFNTDLDNLKYICTFKSNEQAAQDQDYYFVKSPDGVFGNSYIISPNNATQKVSVYKYNSISYVEDLFDVSVRGVVFNVFYANKYWHDEFRLGVSYPTFKKYIRNGGSLSELIPDVPSW